MKKAAIVFIFIIAGGLAALSVKASETLQVHLYVTGLTEQQPPELLYKKLILSLKPQQSARLVGAAFAHESFENIHYFQVNNQGVFFLIFDLPDNISKLDYRLVVDGLWQTDPSNPDTFVNEYGLLCSRYSLGNLGFRPSVFPRPSEAGITFFYQGKPGERVYVAGSFNNWQPFVYRLEEEASAPGYFFTTLVLPAGQIYYHFIVNGRTVRDSRNAAVAVDPAGRQVSIFEVPIIN